MKPGTAKDSFLTPGEVDPRHFELLLEGTSTVTWTIDVEVDGDHKDAAQLVANSYFQARIAAGEQDSACSFVVVDETDQHQVDIDLADSLSDLDGDDTE